MKLNYRDKVILGVLLALVLLIAGFFLLIKPKNEDIKANKETLATLESSKAEVESKIAEIPGIKDDIKEAYSNAATLVDDFVEYNNINNPRKVDQYMQAFAEDSEVKVMTLTTATLATGTLGYYYFTPTFIGEDLISQADINGHMQSQMNSDKAESDSLSERTEETVLNASYTILVTAEDKEDIWAYLSALEEQDETIIINSVSLTNVEIKEREKEEDEDIDALPTAQINITLYSVYEMDEPNVEMD